MTTTQAVPEKDTLLNALRALVAERPNLEPSNYISGWNDADGRRAYHAERREVSAQKADAFALLREIERRSISADDMLQALPSRLVWNAERGEFDYLVGQYWATEYRRAVASYCASVLWAYYRNIWGQADTAEKIRQAATRTLRSRRLVRYFR